MHSLAIVMFLFVLSVTAFEEERIADTLEDSKELEPLGMYTEYLVACNLHLPCAVSHVIRSVRDTVLTAFVNGVTILAGKT